MRKADCVDQISWHQNQSEVLSVSRLRPGPLRSSSPMLEKGFALAILNGFFSEALRVSRLLRLMAMESTVSKLDTCSVAASPSTRDL